MLHAATYGLHPCALYHETVCRNVENERPPCSRKYCDLCHVTAKILELYGAVWHMIVGFAEIIQTECLGWVTVWDTGRLQQSTCRRRHILQRCWDQHMNERTADLSKYLWASKAHFAGSCRYRTTNNMTLIPRCETLLPWCRQRMYVCV